MNVVAAFVLRSENAANLDALLAGLHSSRILTNAATGFLKML
jgi:hypothetical protein